MCRTFKNLTLTLKDKRRQEGGCLCWREAAASAVIIHTGDKHEIYTDLTSGPLRPAAASLIYALLLILRFICASLRGKPVTHTMKALWCTRNPYFYIFFVQMYE